MEFGPYQYRESDTYTELEYKGLDNTISGEELPAVYSTFVQGVEFVQDDSPDKLIDTKMYLTNQALYGVWYQQNLAQAPDKIWRIYLALLYSGIVDGLGN